ncbi:transmembrane 220 family protein [Aquiflexum gelatinilyticum]|uniref:transmembrane 220 family protein n=1 Tax=Aquiflexum gelatinilyticum TaxID=2961943 RepID=UPI002168956F|nr:transmembrane 220 family protein [Aquiflexum gelatinilyticum]MCS4436095.1 transmembrane 220 family protein [Aquiflexum gelatinilyticum]
MKNFPKYFFIFWSIVFLLFAYWQVNDPDPQIWVSVYLLAAIFCGLAVMGKHPLIPLGIIIVASIIGAVYFYPTSVSEWVNYELENKDLTMKTQESEEARETFGLLIIAAILSVSAYFGWKNKI